MSSYRVVIPTIVQEQITEQLLHIAEDSVQNALAWEDRLRAAVESLSNTHGFAVDEPASERLGFTVRKLVFEKTYLIHFVVDDAAKIVRVVNFRHGARLARENEP